MCALLVRQPFMRSYTGTCIVQFRKYEQEEDGRIQQEGQVCSSDLFFIEQSIGNACGTIGLLHALGNCKDQLKFGM